MNKKTYTKPEIEITAFQSEDIITVSGGEGRGGYAALLGFGDLLDEGGNQINY